MLKVTIKNYDSVSDIYYNEDEFCVRMSKNQFFDLLIEKWRYELSYEFWDTLGNLRIAVDKDIYVLIKVVEIDYIQDTEELVNFINNKYIME